MYCTLPRKRESRGWWWRGGGHPQRGYTTTRVLAQHDFCLGWLDRYDGVHSLLRCTSRTLGLLPATMLATGQFLFGKISKGGQGQHSVYLASWGIPPAAPTPLPCRARSCTSVQCTNFFRDLQYWWISPLYPLRVHTEHTLHRLYWISPVYCTVHIAFTLYVNSEHILHRLCRISPSYSAVLYSLSPYFSNFTYAVQNIHRYEYRICT